MGPPLRVQSYAVLELAFALPWLSYFASNGPSVTLGSGGVGPLDSDHLNFKQIDICRNIWQLKMTLSLGFRYASPSIHYPPYIQYVTLLNEPWDKKKNQSTLIKHEAIQISHVTSMECAYNTTSKYLTISCLQSVRSEDYWHLFTVDGYALTMSGIFHIAFALSI